MKEKILKWLVPGLIFIMIILVIAVLGSTFISGTQKDINEQNRQYLSELAEQSALEVSKTVSMQLDKIQTISNIIGTQDEFDIDYAIRILDSEAARGIFKRLAYITPKGDAMTTDEALFNVSEREYFQKAMNGESCVSDVMVDKVGGAFITVYAVPFYFEGTIQGVIIATSDMNVFSDILDISIFRGQGYSYIIKKDGTPVVFGEGFIKGGDGFENLFDELLKTGMRKSEVTNMQNDLQKNVEGTLEFTTGDEQRIGAYCEAGVNDWYIVTSVPREVIFSGADRLVMRNRLSALVITVLLTGLCVLIMAQNYRSSRQLLRLAYVDPLTKGNNLNKFKMLAGKAIAKGYANLYMVRIDIDNFKLVNDMYGYEEGDRILLIMDRLISKILTKEDIYGRVANDNFLCLINCVSKTDVLELGRQFRTQFRELMEDEEKQYSVNFTTGVYKIESGDTDIEKIIDRATMAHRNAKLLPVERKFAFYSNEMRDIAVHVKDIEDAMHQALAEREFVVYLQPKCDLLTGKIEGAEALVRWVHEGKVLSPAYFVPSLERNGFIANVDLYMVEEVCRIQKQWLDMGITPVPISINQSKPLVYGNDYTEKLIQIVQKYQVPPALIELELLESLIHENIEELKRIVDKLHALGFLVCIDDFGSGYSSLNLLKDIQADVLKIDKGFLDKVEGNERAEAILQNIVKMAEDLKMSVVMEGVETQKQAGMLEKIGCDVVQGFLFARPMPVADYEVILKQKVCLNDVRN